MEKLTQSSEILRLGKLLVDELNLDQSVDTLGRWMAHHISDLMTQVSASTGRQKKEVEDRCRDAILTLWRHVDVFQKNHRPLGKTESIFATIQALNPDNVAHFYHSQATNKIEQSSLTEESKKWLELSQGIDYSARLLIGMCLKNVAKEIKSDDEEWLALARTLDADIPQTQIVRVLLDNKERSEQESEETRNQEMIETLQNRKSRLASLVNLAQKLDEQINEDIRKLEAETN